MADCRACGAPIDWYDREDGGRIALDPHEAKNLDDAWQVNDEGKAFPVTGKELALSAHRSTCPHYKRG